MLLFVAGAAEQFHITWQLVPHSFIGQVVEVIAPIATFMTHPVAQVAYLLPETSPVAGAQIELAIPEPSR